jgi:GT2 family glycosyltransferase
MSTTAVDMSIVIVTWNAKKYAHECLTSLLRQNVDFSVEIIVVDNASSDGTPELVRDEFPQVKLIRNDRNLGFAAANNIGLRETTGDCVCLINSDVVVPDGCLETIFQYMRRNPRIGLLGPQMIGPNGTVQRSTMRFPTVWNSFCFAVALGSVFRHSKLWGGFLMEDFAHDHVRDVEVLNGWFWVTRRQALDQVGLLDERFFIYGEDIDWSYRFHQAGWRVVFYPGASALHYGGASSSNAPIRFYIEMQRANLQYWEKHSNAFGKCGYLVSTMLHHVLRVLGYSVVYSLLRSKRDQAAYKVKRSVASIRWLCGRRQEA